MFPRWRFVLHVEWTRRARGQGLIFPIREKYHGDRMERDIVIEDVVFYSLSILAWVVMNVGR